MENKVQQRKAGIIWSYMNLGLSVLLSLFYTPFMLSLMGKSEYGLYTIAASVISYLSILDLGMGNTYVRFTARYRAQKDEENESRLNGTMMLLYAGLGLIALIGGLWIAANAGRVFDRTFTAEELRKIRVILTVLTVNSALSFPLSVFGSNISAHEFFSFRKILTFCETVVKHGMIIVFLLLGGRSIAMAVIGVTTSMAVRISNMIFCMKKIRPKFRFKWMGKDVAREIIGYSFFIFMGTIVNLLYTSTDQVILGAVVGTTAAAVYGVGTNFNQYFNQLSTSINDVFLPHVTHIVATGADRRVLSDLFIRNGRLQFMILTLAGSAFILFGKTFIELWTRNSGYGDAYWIAVILIIPGIIPLSQNMGITILRAMNLHRYRAMMYLAIAILNVVISIGLAKRYAGIGAAMGTAIGNVLGQILFMNWFYKTRIGLDIGRYWREMGKLLGIVLCVALPGSLLNLLFPRMSWLHLVLRVGIYCIALSLVLYRFAFNDFERELVRSTLGKFRKGKSGGAREDKEKES